MNILSKKAMTLGLMGFLATSAWATTKVEKVQMPAPYGLESSSDLNCVSPIERVFNFKNGKLTPAVIKDSKIVATYIGLDNTTGDSALINDFGKGSYQLILRNCQTSDPALNNLLQNAIPQVAKNFNIDLNVENKISCPGRINSLQVVYGYVQGGYQGNNVPVYSSFSPTQECL